MAGKKRTTKAPAGAPQPPWSGGGSASSNAAVSNAAASREARASTSRSSDTEPTSPKQKKASPAGSGRTPPRRGAVELSDADLSDGSSREGASKEAAPLELDSESEYPELTAAQRAARRSDGTLPAVAEETRTHDAGGTASESLQEGAAPAPLPPTQLAAEARVVTARFSAMSARAASYALCACFLLVSAQARPGLRPHMVSAHARPGLCPHTRTRRKPNETSHGSRRKPEEPSYGSACVMELDNRSYDRPIKFRSIKKGSGNSFPHCTASDETPRYARSTRRRRFAKRYWTCQITATRNVTQVWYTLNWNIICQRLPWQSAGSGGDHA